MAFSKDNLIPVAVSRNTDSPSLWFYTTTGDNLAAVKGSGYFDNGATTNTGMRNLLQAGDVVIVVTSDSVASVIAVAAVTSGVITVESNDINAA